MRLSEAILLGDSLKRSNPDVFISQEGCSGCALGGALLAVGVTGWRQYMNERVESGDGWVSMPTVRKNWPWLTEKDKSDIGTMYFTVCKGLMTLEQLADYVRSIEPDEPAESVETTQEVNTEKVRA